MNTVKHFKHKIVFLLLFLTLYTSSYCFILLLRKRKSDLLSGTYEDAIAYRTSLWVSTFSLSISIGAALLHPISIITNEILHAYPNSYYMQWLNSSLIQGLWSLVFLFSNVALFLFLPFAHLFLESEGFPGSSRGVTSRIHEVLLVLGLMGLLIMGITYIISAAVTGDEYSITSIFYFSNYYLPFLYSCISFLGVLMLLLCTPVGFARLFTVLGDVIVKPKTPSPLRALLSSPESLQVVKTSNEGMSNVEPCTSKPSKPIKQLIYNENDGITVNAVYKSGKLTENAYKRVASLPTSMSTTIKCEIGELDEETEELLSELNLGSNYSRRKTFKRNFLYPFVMLVLVLLTTLSVLMVIQNSLALCFGIKSLPVYSQNITLGLSSLSTIGPVGALFEVVLILYLWCASIVGLYSLPLFRYLRPKFRETSMTQIMGNCALLLILSSALPVLSRSIGLTNLDLLGAFGRINWLGNFYIVLFHNIVFTVSSIICLGTKITAAVRKELYNKICKISSIFPYSHRKKQSS